MTCQGVLQNLCSYPLSWDIKTILIFVPFYIFLWTFLVFYIKVGWLECYWPSCRLQWTLTFWQNETFLDSFLHNPMSNDLTKTKPRLFYKYFIKCIKWDFHSFSNHCVERYACIWNRIFCARLHDVLISGPCLIMCESRNCKVESVRAGVWNSRILYAMHFYLF